MENFLCAVGAMVSVGFEIETVLKEAAKLMPPAGRMQIVREDQGPIFAVDYSHTPDAVTQAINALEGLAKARGGRIWIVVGAGGDRDHGKRPLMGQATMRRRRSSPDVGQPQKRRCERDTETNSSRDD